MATRMEIGSTTEAAVVRFSFFRFVPEFLQFAEAQALRGDVDTPAPLQLREEQREILREMEQAGETSADLVQLFIDLGFPPELCEMATQPPSTRHIAATFALVARLCELTGGLDESDRAAFEEARPAAVLEIRMSSPLVVLVEVPAFVSVPAAVVSFVLAVERVTLAPARVHAKKKKLQLAAAKAVHDQLALEEELSQRVVPLARSSLAIDRVDIYDDSAAVSLDTVEEPGFLPPGTWKVDPIHSSVEFQVKHLGIATVKGQFKEFAGTLEVTGDGVNAQGSVQTSSIDTREPQRDDHPRSVDFFDTAQHPQITFKSTFVRPIDDEAFEIEGDFTLLGITRPLKLTATLEGAETDREGNPRIGFSASAQISRDDHDMKFNMTLGSDNVVIGDKVKILLAISAVKDD